jgi:hypothetical protein
MTCRTPIHGVMGLTALVLESELTDDQRESLVSVKECADLLLHIINSRKMVSSTFRMLQARAQEQGLKLWWEVDKSVPTSFVGDVGKLQQCLLNLGLILTHHFPCTNLFCVCRANTEPIPLRPPFSWVVSYCNPLISLL